MYRSRDWEPFLKSFLKPKKLANFYPNVESVPGGKFCVFSPQLQVEDSGKETHHIHTGVTNYPSNVELLNSVNTLFRDEFERSLKGLESVIGMSRLTRNNLPRNLKPKRITGKRKTQDSEAYPSRNPPPANINLTW